MAQPLDQAFLFRRRQRAAERFLAIFDARTNVFGELFDDVLLRRPRQERSTASR
jgi:hypothetical protein